MAVRKKGTGRKRALGHSTRLRQDTADAQRPPGPVSDALLSTS